MISIFNIAHMNEDFRFKIKLINFKCLHHRLTYSIQNTITVVLHCTLLYCTCTWCIQTHKLKSFVTRNTLKNVPNMSTTYCIDQIMKVTAARKPIEVARRVRESLLSTAVQKHKQKQLFAEIITYTILPKFLCKWLLPPHCYQPTWSD